jgi:hypothetical protein
MPTYIGNLLVDNAYLGSNPITLMQSTSQSVTLPPVIDGLYFYLDSRNYESGSNVWWPSYNATGDISAKGVLTGSVLPTYTTASSFQLTQFQAIDVSASLNFGLLQTYVDYTVFIVGRQNGLSTDKHGRLLNSKSNRNWLLGTFGTSSQAMNTNGTWVFGPANAYDTKWRVHTATLTAGVSASYYVNGIRTGSLATGNYLAGPLGFGINTGSFCNGTAGGGENNTCEIADIVVYNKALSASQIATVSTYLGARYGV